jgi:hypothetical protein
MATPPESDDGASDRTRLDDSPPFSTWRTLYGVVLAVLAAQVVIYAVLTRVMR